VSNKILSDALGMIDDSYIQECIVYQVRDACSSSERNRKMKKYGTVSQKGKILVALCAVVCLVLSLVITAGAANLWGIRELLSNSDRDISEQADDYIQPQSSSAQEAEWDCRMTEALFDNNQIVLTVVVSCAEDYILIPTDFSAGNPASSIGIDSDKTLGEYAEDHNRMLLNVGAGINNSDTLRVCGGFIHFENVSENQMVILLQTEVETSESAPQGICTVYVGGKQTVLEFTTMPAPDTNSRIFIPAERNAVPGIVFGSATVTENLLGVSVTAEEIVTDEDAFELMEIRIKELTVYEGGSVFRDGRLYLDIINGQGAIGDTMTVQIYNVETGALIGEIVFVEQ